ncbi:amino acid ABC transporter substrate-binding protein [Dyella humicola]|uniref:amino acid ABC transporter substrate-binding protein n=1 Tax=Dyella humicola TaxID=2992126 RepID=UPI0022510453|nr:amino acid ABC transporter substrate-binding protein [Dyella humicola]
MQIARLMASKKFTWPLILLIAAVMAPSMLLAQTQAPAASTLDRIRAAGKITLGYYANAKPVSFKDDSGKIDGYAIALCRLIAADVQSKLGLSNLPMDFVAVDANERYSAVKEGRIDLVCGPSEATLARRADVSYSIPVLSSGIGILVRRDSPAAFRDLLEGLGASTRPVWRGSPRLQVLEERRFAVIGGSSAERLLTERRAELNVHAFISVVPDLATGIGQVINGRADGFVADRTVLLDLAQRDPSGSQVMVLNRIFDREALSFVLSRNDDDFRLLVDSTLSRLYRSGKIDTIYAQFFGAPDAAMRDWFHNTALPD